MKLFACGDIVNYHNADGLVCGADLESVIKNADYAVCNFEAPVAGYGVTQPKSGPHLNQLPVTIKGLKKQGFDLLLLANNHMLDFGRKGLEATIREAKKHGFDVAGAGVNGAAAYAPLIKEIGGIKFGILNACEAQFGVIDHFSRFEAAGYAWINHPRIDKTILQLKKECDFVIVFSHAGLENHPIPQKEWRVRYKHLCDLGADVIVGSHPHVPQGYENYGESLIFYSLGNFYFDSNNFRDKEDSSFAVCLDLQKNNRPSFKPIFYYKNDGKVHLAPEEKRIELEKLNNMLDNGYLKAHDQMSLEAYEKIRRDLIYSLSPLPYNGKFMGSLKLAIKTVLGQVNRDKDLLQLHLLRNEAYYYALRHALELKAKEKLSEQ